MPDAFPTADAPLDLSRETPVFTGQQQIVYAWPGRPELLIKVVRPGFADEHWTGWRGSLKRRRRLGVLASAHRAVTEQLALRNAGATNGRVQTVVGFVETSEGVGLVARALRGKDGGYAPTLRSLIDAGHWGPALEARLDEFLDWMLDAPLVVGDLHAGNLVLGYDPEFGERLVMIDGMGDKGFIPLNSLVPFLNRRHKQARAARLRETIGRIAARVAAARSREASVTGS